MGAAGPADHGARRGLLAVLCLMSVTGPMATFLYLPALPDVARAFGTDEAGAQVTLTVFLGGNCIGYALLGPANDRFGQKRVFVSATVVFILSSLLCALAPSLALLSAARLVQGMGAAVGIITARATVRQSFPDGGAGAISVLSAIAGIGPAVSPLIGALIMLVADWRGTFLISAAVSALTLMLALRILPEEDRAASGPSSGYGAYRRIFGHPEIRAGLLMGSLNNGMFVVMMAGSPFVFVSALGWSPLAYSLFFGLALACFSVISVMAGKSFPRRGLRSVISRGMPGMVAGAALLLGGALAEQVWAVAGGLFLMVASMGPLVPGNHLRMLYPFPELAGTVAGVSMLVVTSTGMALISAYGAASAGSVLGYAVWIAGLAILSVLWWLVRPAKDPSAASS